MDKKELARWRKYNTLAEEVDPSSFISEHGLRLIDNLEGHGDIGYKVVNGQGTTYHGVTQEGLDGLKELTIKYSVKVPNDLVGADVKTITKEQAKTATQYIAVLNTMLVNDFTETTNFQNWDQTARDAFLSYFHYNSPYKLRKSLNDDNPGSTLKAIKSNNPCRAAQTLLLNSDGTFYGEYVKADGKLDPYVKRAAAAILAMRNPDYEFDKEQARDTENRLKQPDFSKESVMRLGRMADDYDKPTLVSALLGGCDDADIIDASKGNIPADEETTAQASQTEPVQTSAPKPMFSNIDLKSAFTDFTNTIKNLFTNNQEKNDAQ